MRLAKYSITLFITILAIFFGGVAVADRGDDVDYMPRKSIVILEIYTEYAAGDEVILTIVGINFLGRKGKAPYISIGQNLGYDLISYTDNKLMLEADLADGDYLILVSTDRKFKAKKTAAFNLTIGAIGSQGEMGSEGPKGEKGDVGSQGQQGVPGLKGDTGNTGPQGLRGERGPKGDKGDKGDQGAMGFTGSQGSAGAVGSAGKDGADGTSASVDTVLQNMKLIVYEKGMQDSDSIWHAQCKDIYNDVIIEAAGGCQFGHFYTGEFYSPSVSQYSVHCELFGTRYRPAWTTVKCLSLEKK